MKFLVLALFIGLTSASALHKRAVPSGSEVDAPVIRYNSEVKTDGFNYNYETGNGIKGEASGVLKKYPEGEALAIQGQYSYTGPDNQPISVSYVADESGYHPEGAHLPVPPPTPEAILRALQYIQAHPAPVDKQYKN